MKTRQGVNQEREKWREKSKQRLTVERKEKKKKNWQKYKRNQKIAKKLKEDELLYWKNRSQELEEKVKRLSEKIEESEGYEFVEFPDLHGNDKGERIQPEEESESEEVIEDDEMKKTIDSILMEAESVKVLTRRSPDEFFALVDEVKESFQQTTWRGTDRKDPLPKTDMDPKYCIFITLYWLAHYPTISVLSCLMHIHPRTCTRILKRTTVAMAKVLKPEIKWPSDEEFEQLTFNFFNMEGFPDCVCVVDGSEIRISRPSDDETQRKTWSGKKKQNSLNVMFITKLNGEIVYFSPLRVGAHDQSHWNELHLRDWFKKKEYGIMGDGGFTFNVKNEKEQIKGYKPAKKPKGGVLTPQQKLSNKKLSQLRVVVENSIRCVKRWKILAGTFRHWRYGKGQISGDNILTICVVLANREIKKRPLRDADWVHPSLRKDVEIFKRK